MEQQEIKREGRFLWFTSPVPPGLLLLRMSQSPVRDDIAWRRARLCTDELSVLLVQRELHRASPLADAGRGDLRDGEIDRRGRSGAAHRCRRRARPSGEGRLRDGQAAD